MKYKVQFSIHSAKRMFERSITVDDVLEVILHGKLVEDYPDDTPYPSRLLVGWTGNRPIHIIIAENVADLELVVVTVYEPDPEKWDEKYSRRVS